MRGLFKREYDSDDSKKGLGKLGKRLRNHLNKKLDDEQRKEELIKAVREYRKDILDRIMKE